MRHIELACIVSVALALLGAEAGAEIYKWTDKDGKVHYSDQPPPELAVKKMPQHKPPTPPPSVPAAAASHPEAAKKGPPTAADKELEYRKRKVAAEEAEKKEQLAQEDAKRKQAHCGALKGDYKSLSDGGRITRYDEKGEKVFLDDKGIETELARVKRELEENCK